MLGIYYKGGRSVFVFFEDNTIEFLFHRIEYYIKKIGVGDMFPAQQIYIPRQQSRQWGLTGIKKEKIR